MPAASARAIISSRDPGPATEPASTASTAAPPAPPRPPACRDRPRGRRSGSRASRATAFTTTAPGPARARCRGGSLSVVPSIASTALIAPRLTTTVWPTLRVGDQARHREPATDVRPLGLGRRAARRRAGGSAEPVAEERPLVEQLDAQAGERRHDGLGEVAVEQRAGAAPPCARARRRAARGGRAGRPSRTCRRRARRRSARARAPRAPAPSRRCARGPRRSARSAELGGAGEREGDHAPAPPSRLAAIRAGSEPAPHISPRARIGRSGTGSRQATSATPSRIIRSISSAMASERRSSGCAAGTGSPARRRRVAPTRCWISSLSGLSR